MCCKKLIELHFEKKENVCIPRKVVFYAHPVYRETQTQL
jgi:hypothetical protein